MRNLVLSIFLGALATSSFAGIVIDNFQDSQGPLTVDQNNPALINRVNAAGAIGGSRALYLGLMGSANKRKSTVVVDNGAFGNNEFGNSSRAVLGYFTTSVAQPGTFFYSGSTDYDMSSATEFKFDVLGTDGNIDVRIDLFSYDVNTATLSARKYQKTFLDGGARVETIGLSDVTLDQAAFDVTKVDFMWIWFESPTNADFGLQSIEAVPEPGTIAGIGIGLAALARRRRK